MSEGQRVAELERRLAVADAALRAHTGHAGGSEGRYQSIFAAMDEGICVVELIEDAAGKAVDWRWIEVNAAYERHTGLVDVVGRRGSEVIPGTEASWLALYDDIVRTGQPQRVERYHEPTGRWYNVYVARVDGVDRPTVCLVFKDVTGRRRTDEILRGSEERQAFLLKLADGLRPLADPEAIQAAAARLLGRHLGANQVHYGETVADTGDEATIVVHQGYGDGLPPMVGMFRHRAEGWGERLLATYRAGRTGVCRDVDADPTISAAEAAVLSGAGIRAYVSVPLVKEGVWRATLAVHSIAPRAWTAAEIALVEDVAERTWAAVERARAEAALRDSEQRFRALVTAGTYSIYRMSADWRLMYQLDSATLANTVGPIEDWIDKYILEADRPAVFAAIDKAIRTRSLFELEHRVLLADGSIGWVLSRAVPLFDADGTIVEWFGAGSDVTDRRRIAERLREQERVHRDALEREVRERTAELKSSRDLLKATMDSSLDMIQVFEAVRDGAGAIVDFRWILNNHASESRYGRVIGERLLVRNPGVVSEGIFDAFRKVVESGAPSQAERHYVHEQFDGWFLQSVVRLGDGVATTTKDISDWKAAQNEVLNLQEEVARSQLREAEERLALVFRTLPVGVAILGLAGNTITANEEMRRFMPNGIIPSREPGAERRWRGFGPDGSVIAPGDFPGARALRGDTVAGVDMLYRQEDGREVWTQVHAAPLLDEDRRVAGAFTVVVDIDRLKRGEEAVRQSEERLRQFGEASQDVLWIRDADTLQWQYLTVAFETIYGLGREEALTGDNYRSWLDLIVAADRDIAAAAIGRVRRGEHVTFEYRIRRPSDGAIRWLRNTDFPITDASGEVTLIGGIGEDITEAKISQDAVERSEERLRSAIEVGRLGLWDWNVQTGELHWSDEYYRMEGYAVGEVTPGYDIWMSRIHPDDRVGTEQVLHHAMAAREEYAREFRVVHPDGSIHWLSGRGRFFYDDDGQPVRMIGAMIETTERREWEERQKVLVAELQHRTRNLIGVVRSISDKTARSSADLPDFRARFRDRLDALARVQGLLSRLNDYDRVTFDELIRTELAAMNGHAEQAFIDGPAGVRLRSSTVQTLAMALHELATNAVKYGALGQPNGQLSVRWSLAPRDDRGQPWLHIDWRESGVEMPAAGAPPRGSGQGRELIERALPYQLGARTSYELGSDGVHCTITIPISTNGEDGRHG